MAPSMRVERARSKSEGAYQAVGDRRDQVEARAGYGGGRHKNPAAKRARHYTEATPKRPPFCSVSANCSPAGAPLS